MPACSLTFDYSQEQHELFIYHSYGVLTQQVGDIIDWKNRDWQKRFKPE